MSFFTGCPVSGWVISTSNTAVIAPTGLNSPVDDENTGKKIVKPTDNTLHASYNFYSKITADGGSEQYFGLYYLHIGCISGGVTFIDNGSATGIAKYVGDTTAGVYTFVNPTIGQSWCSIVSNIAVEDDETTPSSKVNNCGTQVCTVFSLVDTN